MTIVPTRAGPPTVAVICMALTALTLASPTAVAGQQEEARRSSFGFFSIGVHRAGLGSLNTQLAAADFPTFRNAMLSLGGGGYGVNESGLLLGGEGYGLIGGEHAANGRTVGLGGGAGFFNIGWVFPVTETLRVYPMGALGGGGLALHIGPAGSSDSFGEVLEDPDREVRIQRGGMLVGGGVGAELRLGGSESGLLVGARATYVTDAVSTAWRMGGSALAGGPSGGLDGFQLRLSIGGGRGR